MFPRTLVVIDTCAYTALITLYIQQFQYIKTSLLYYNCTK